MKRSALLALIFLGLSFSACSADMIFSIEGKPQYSIEVSENATLAEQTAARELQAYLEKAAGGKPDLVFCGENSGGKRIIVGHTDFTRQNQINPDELGPEEWIIREIDGNLVLTGGRPRGVLYAVYGFLENSVGIRWWTPWEEKVPHDPNLRITVKDESGEPVFRQRDIWSLYLGDEHTARFAARNRLNLGTDQSYQNFGEEYGFEPVYGPPKQVHTFHSYVPPAIYFENNPEFFSLVDGERTRRGQLCLTNPDLRVLIREKLVSFIEEPEKRVPRWYGKEVYTISPEDWLGACECENCQEIALREGSESGPILDFVNHIADSIRDRYPDIFIETHAYMYYRQPPEHIKPRDNVIICLANLSMNHTFPITHPENREFFELLRGWSEIAENLRIWEYGIYFGGGAGFPFPSAHNYAENFRTYHQAGAEKIFVEHGLPVSADVRDFKIWMTIKLLENPYLDAKKLEEAFAKGYYGDAGPSFLRYRSLLRGTPEKNRAYLSVWNPTAAAYRLMDLNTITASHELFEEGSDLIAGNAVLERRWRHARLSLDRVTLHFWRQLLNEWNSMGKAPSDFPLRREDIASRAGQALREQWRVRYGEGRRAPKFLNFEREIEHQTLLPEIVKVPEKFRDVPRENIFDFTPETVRNIGNIAKTVADPDAETGFTNKLPFPNPGGDRHGLERYRLPISWGLYSQSGRRMLGGSTISPGDVPGPGYHWYKMGTYRLEPLCFIYFFSSWIIQADVGSAYDAENPEQDFEIWTRIKFEGPGFPHGVPEDENSISIERIVLVKK